MMRTGFDMTGQSDNRGNEMMQTMLGIIQPVFEQGIVLAAEYCKACGRDVMLDEDIEYAMKYCIMHKVGQQVGSIFGEENNFSVDEEEEEEEIEVVPVDELPKFQRYSGNNQMIMRINKAYDEWKDWKPESPAQEILKNALDNNEFEVRDARGMES
jgi:hypothetical protein